MPPGGRSSLGIVFATVALDLVGFGMVVPMLPLYAQKFGATGSRTAWLLASYSLMQLVFAPLWGRLSDRIGRRPVLLFSIAANAVCLAAFGLAPRYGWLLAARLGAGMFAANISVASAYVADLTAGNDAAARARGMGMIGAAFGIGFVVGPFIGGELSVWGLSTPALAAAALGAVNFALALWRLPESLPAAARRAATESLWRQRLGVLRGGRGLGVLLLLTFMQVLGFAMLELALVLFARGQLGISARGCGRLLGYMGLVLALVQGGLIGRLVRRLGEARVATLGLGLLALGMALVPALGAHGRPALVAVLALVAVGQGMASPVLSSLLSRLSAGHVQGATLGLGQSVSALGRVVGPELAGTLLDRGGTALPFWAGAAVLAVAAALAAARLRALATVRP